MNQKKFVKKTPQKTSTEAEILALSHTNVMIGQWMISIEPPFVTLEEAVYGDGRIAQKFDIPRRAFDKLIRWYLTGKVPREDKLSRDPKTQKSMMIGV